MDGFAIVPPQGGEGFVELSRSKQGRIFEKHILSFGELLYPGVRGGKVQIDQGFADTLMANFSNKVCDIVQVPKAGPNNEHTEDPDRNIGEVVGLVTRDKKIYAQIDARIEADADKLGKTLLGASAMMHLNYKDTRTGKAVGPTLLHVAVTNRPYVLDLDDYTELLAASADGTNDAVFLTAPTKEKPMTLDDLLAELKADHNIDVPALQLSAENADKALALSNKIQEELIGTGLLTLSNGGEATADDLVGAVAEAGTKLLALSGRVDELVEASTKVSAEARVDSLIRSGHILPKNKAAQVKLLLSNSDLFDELVPDKPIVKLSNEGGFETIDESHKETVDSEIARLSSSPAAAAYIRR